MDIEKIDKNFKTAIVNNSEFNYYNPRHAPFVLEGFPFLKKDTAPYCRLPLESLSFFSEGLQFLAYHTAGGQIRFCTDSPAIAIKATIGEKSGMNHMPASGQSSFDCYCGIGKDKKFIG
ncbi:MAG: SGNH/GDSL hydrolase N-terminal domain-containing protein, partial [Lentisphaeria bacterium]